MFPLVSWTHFHPSCFLFYIPEAKILRRAGTQIIQKHIGRFKAKCLKTSWVVLVCAFVCVHVIIYEEQQMNSSIGWINVFSKSPEGQREKREQRKKTKETKPESRRSIECVFLSLKNRPQRALKGGIILSSKRTFGYSWLAERLRGLKEDTVRMGLNIKVNLRSAGPVHESTITGAPRSQRGVMGGQLSGGWTALWMRGS